MNINSTEIEEGLRQLNELSVGEFGASLSSILSDPDTNLVFKRLGQLIAVWPKSAFAESFPYDTTLSTNWAKSSRCWEIHYTPSPDQISENWAKAELLVMFASDWDRPVERLFEFNIFLSICKKLKPIICSESKIFKDAEKASKELQKQGYDVSLVNTNQLIAIAALSTSNYFVNSVGWLNPEHAPMVLGCTLLILCFGQNNLCQLISNFIDSDDPKKDRLANVSFAVCSSQNPSNGQSCKNRVSQSGTRCWIHANEDG